MRIGIDGHMIGDYSGGNESYYQNVLQNMKLSAQDEVFLFVKKGTNTSKYADFNIISFRFKNALFRNFIELPLLCLRYKLDLLHTQYFIPFFRPCKVVCTIHDICFEHYKNIFTKKEYITQKLLIPYAAKRSEYIFTVSNHAKEDIVEHYKINPCRVVITYNAVNNNFRKLSSEVLNEKELRDKYSIGNNEYILTVGNLQPRKNLPRLIEAFNRWRDKRDSGKLVIVGKKAWMYDDILKAVGVNSQNIVLTDYVSEEDLVRLYNAASCFVYPSFYEGSGIPPLESMSCGTPVAVSNVTSLPEVVGDAGIYFEPFNVDEIEYSIEKIMADDQLREELAERGLRRKNMFNWEQSSKKIIETYHTCESKIGRVIDEYQIIQIVPGNDLYLHMEDTA